MNFKKNVQTFSADNVAAIIRGYEFPDEYVILSAHLDHVGVQNGDIYNGADDNGSGTVAMLEIAEAFSLAMEQGYTPKRSIIFLHVTAEERGLLGSEYYADYDPLVPINKTIANLNMDMMGRAEMMRVVRWMEPLLDFIRAAHDAEIPLFGVCLGSQLFARALGGTVESMEEGPRLGWAGVDLSPDGREDPLHKGLPWNWMQFHWNRDSVRELPGGARVLSRGDRGDVQGWRLGVRTYGVQYHPELKSRPFEPHPLFTDFIRAAVAQSRLV